MNKTKIEWADYTWNVITGCYGPGGTAEKPNRCPYCYAHRMAKRLRGRAGYPEDDPFRPTFHDNHLWDPLSRKKPSRVFVCSMGELFGESVTARDLAYVLRTMRVAREHTYLVLTKRPERIAAMLREVERLVEENESVFWPLYQAIDECKWPLPNLWLGTSCENQAAANERIPHLLATPAAHRFVSLEPLLGDISLHPWIGHPRLRPDGKGWAFIGDPPLLDWVIIGAQTQPTRLPDPAWVDSIINQCRVAGVPCFCKDNLAPHRSVEHIRQWPEAMSHA